jgi:serine/threonine-protein kinase
MSAEAALPLRPGDVVAGRYEIDRVLGVGGMGAVFAAHDRLAARHLPGGGRVAIKSLLPEHLVHADVVARFAREARATRRLKSDHVARVIDDGVLASGLPFMVMELLDGRDLKSLVKASGPLPVREAAAYVCQACVALAEAHALGIIHRDLKPANLFLTRRADGAAMIKVLDFGIAKFSSPNIAGDGLDVTGDRSLLGSRAYMAPEQMLRPKEVDARADVWSLGVILYFLVTARNPFVAETAEGVVMRVVQDEPDPIAEARLDVPEGFDRVVRRCLAKARENRYSSAIELARALAPFAKDRSLADDRTTLELPRAERRSLGPLIAAAIALGVLAAHTTQRLAASPLRISPAMIVDHLEHADGR